MNYCRPSRRTSAARLVAAHVPMTIRLVPALALFFWAAVCPLPAAAADASYPRLKQIIIVYKMHFDIGYSALARDVVHDYRTSMVDRTIEEIEKNRTRPKEEQFVWTVPGWPLEQMLWSGQDPSRKAKIEEAIRQGNIVPHALAFSTETETLELEDLVRSLGHSSQIARTYGQTLPRDAKMTDVPEHTWILPTLLRHAGIEFLHIGCNDATAPALVPLLFWWEGPDGSRLLTMYAHTYGTSPLPPEDWPHATWVYISHTGDNAGPPEPETVQKDMDYYRKTVPGAKVRIGRLADFADAILGEKPNLPVVHSDMPDVWVHGLMSSPLASKLARDIRLSIGTTDMLSTLEKSWGIFVPDLKDTIAAAYEQSLLYGEHTWGLAAQSYRLFPYGKGWEEMLSRGLPPAYRRLEESWDEHDDYIRTAQRLILRPLANAVSTLADNVNVEKQRIVVFNPLPWKRDGLVEAVCYWPKFNGVKPTDEDAPVPVALDGIEAKVVRFVAKDIPPLGYRTYVPVSVQITPPAALVADQAAGVIESPYFRAKLDPAQGRIVSLIDKRTGRELVDNSAPEGFGQYLYERFGKAEVRSYLKAFVMPSWMETHGPVFDKMDVPDDSVYRSALPAHMDLHLERSPVEVSAVMTGALPGPGMPQSVSIRLTLYQDLPVADVEVGVEKKPDGWPEAGWICLPFKIAKPSFRLGRLGSTIDPVTDIVAGSNSRQLWLNTGATIFDDAGGVGICPLDSPLISLGEPGSRKYSVRYTPEKSRVYVNLYNNQYATNFREWWGGRLSSRVRLWTFAKYQTETSLYTPAMEARVPLSAAPASYKAGTLPPGQAGIVLSRKGIAVTAFGPNPDGPGTILRLWEQTGTSGEVTVTLPQRYDGSQAIPVNLRGEKTGDPVSLASARLKFKMAAYAPVSFVLVD